MLYYYFMPLFIIHEPIPKKSQQQIWVQLLVTSEDLDHD